MLLYKVQLLYNLQVYTDMPYIYWIVIPIVTLFEANFVINFHDLFVLTHCSEIIPYVIRLWGHLVYM